MKMKKNIIANKQNMQKYIFIIAMLIIPLVQFAFFYVYINANALLLSFQFPLKDGSGSIAWGFENYKIVFEQFKNADSDVLEALKNTIIWFFTSNFICTPLSLIICYFTYKKILHYQFFRTIIYLPCIISATILVSIFKYIVQDGGPVYALFDLLGKEHIQFIADSNYTMKTMLFYVITMTLGSNFVLFGGTMNAIPPEQIEAGKIDGCGPFREFISIVIPNVWPTLGTLWVIGFTGILSASGPVFLFSNGKDPLTGTNTLSYWIYNLTSQGVSAGDENLASAVGMLMSLVSMPIVFIVKSITGVTKDA